MNTMSFQGGKETLSHRIVPTIALATHALNEAVLLNQGSK
jgi:hypothetical protein